MANLKKNGNLSGAIGNIVFVNDGKRTFARVKPDKVKQTPETKAAARIFGLVSAREKMFRLQLLRILGIRPLQYFAARHRARIRKTIVGNPATNSENTPQFGDPQGLAGFSFNPKMEWQSCTNFFPEVESTSTTEIKVHLPEIKWKTQIIPPKNCNSAVVTLFVISAYLNSIYTPVRVLSSIEMKISATDSFPAQEWVIPTDSAEGWLLMVSCVKFASKNQPLIAMEEFSAAYLWAQQVEG
ncbi:MAG: hypothetical protein L0G11_03900 [Chryseobacterium sp.]|nr:hypothetical protein [Chryseobacterium sp.]